MVLHAVFGLRERAKVIVGSAAMLVACATARICRRLIHSASSLNLGQENANFVTVIS